MLEIISGYFTLLQGDWGRCHQQANKGLLGPACKERLIISVHFIYSIIGSSFSVLSGFLRINEQHASVCGSKHEMHKILPKVC